MKGRNIVEYAATRNKELRSINVGTRIYRNSLYFTALSGLRIVRHPQTPVWKRVSAKLLFRYPHSKHKRIYLSRCCPASLRSRVGLTLSPCHLVTLSPCHCKSPRLR